MIRFRLKSVPDPDIDVEENPKEWEKRRLDYAHTLRQIIRTPLDPSRGADIEEIGKGLRLFKALEGKKAGDIIELEDEDHKNLCAKLNAFRYGIVDGRIVEFHHIITNATQTVFDLDTPDPEVVDGVAGRMDG